MAYTELNTGQNLIRLLHLSPASSEDDIIRCRFTVALLDNNPEYEALSYAWGDITDTCSVEVEGNVVHITSNLHSALKHLRFNELERTLWVDALCINQENVRERKHQVSRMSSIYGQASKVIVWLGEGWDGSDMAMEFVRILGEDKTLHLDPFHEPSVCVNGMNLDSSQLRRNLIRFFGLPWWNRTWVVQEFVLAQNLIFQCSRSEIPRDIMYFARENFWHHMDHCCLQYLYDSPAPGLSIRDLFEQSARLDHITHRREGSYSVLTAILSFCQREVSDSRDRVYGMLGLGTGPYADLVEPDYTLSAQQVCEAVVVQSVKRTGTLEFLSHLFDHKNPRVPSFIPNWTEPSAWQECFEHRLSSITQFKAARDIRADFKILSHETAATTGIIFDVIDTTYFQPAFSYDRSPEGFEQLLKFAGVETSAQHFYASTKESRLVAFWHTLCGGVETYSLDSNRYKRRLKGSTDLSKYSKWKLLLSESQVSAEEVMDNGLYYTLLDIDSAIRDRRFFITEKGHFGFGPENCKVGDLVVVLAGGNVPYIIRLVTHLSDRMRATMDLTSAVCYTMLGDSYVHGIMDGEVFELVGESEREMKEIVLV